jgi:hypothetical protein
LAFLVFLISLLQYASAFSLFALNPKKHIIWPAITLVFVLYKSFLIGMYHDAIMWILFFGILYMYIVKPSLKTKLVGLLATVLFILFIPFPSYLCHQLLLHLLMISHFDFYYV